MIFFSCIFFPLFLDLFCGFVIFDSCSSFLCEEAPCCFGQAEGRVEPMICGAEEIQHKSYDPKTSRLFFKVLGLSSPREGRPVVVRVKQCPAPRPPSTAGVHHAAVDPATGSLRSLVGPTGEALPLLAPVAPWKGVETLLGTGHTREIALLPTERTACSFD